MWKKEYHRLYFSETYGDRNLLGAFDLKRDNAPDNLYKYMKSEHALTSLKDDYIKVSDPFDVNDPFEGDLLFDYELLSSRYKDDILFDELDRPDFELSEPDKLEIINSPNPLAKLTDILYDNRFFLARGCTREEFKEEFSNVFKEFEKYSVRNFNRELKKQVLFVCLSEHNNIVPMWAHYADNHAGVCVGYNLSEFELGFEETCHPILYVEHSDFTEEINGINDRERNKLKLLDEPFLKKSIDWSYEDEWRILLNKIQLKQTFELGFLHEFMAKHEDLCFIKFPKPDSVFLGLRISSEDENDIVEICSERAIKVYKMIKDDGGYNLRYGEI